MGLAWVFVRVVFVMALAALVSACGGGGGGGGGNSCSGGQNVYTSLSYSNLTLSLNVGTAFTPKVPSTPGIPAACMDSRRFAISSGSLPPGVSINSSTGVISGAATSGGYYTYQVSVTLTGFTGSVASGFGDIVHDQAAYTFQAWGSSNSGIPFLNDFRLDAISTTFIVTSAGFYSNLMDTFTSTDGVSWQQSLATGPTPLTRYFSTVSDGTSVYLSGGVTASNNYTNHVWKFDGTSWSQITAAAQFPARKGHAMAKLGGNLYVIGGENASGLLGDVWRSADDGVNWTQVATPFSGPGLTRTQVCAVTFNNKLVVMGGKDLMSTRFTEVWQSPDGVTWSQVSLPQGSAFRELARLGAVSQQCATMNGRVYYLGMDQTVSSANLIDWQFEPANLMPSQAPGAVSINGKIYAIDGMGTSQRTVYNTIP